MLGKQVLITILLLIVSTTGQSNNLLIKLSSATQGNCEKVLQKQDGPLQITHARVLTLDQNGEITKNVVCTRKDVSGEYLQFKCEDRIEKNANNVIMIAVTATENTMASQIEYRYKVGTMKMFEKRITDPEEVAKQSFESKAHIGIQEIKFTNDYTREYPKTCITEKTYPDNLIADHGLYVSNSLDNEAEPLTWTRIYFDPVGLGERLIRS